VFGSRLACLQTSEAVCVQTMSIYLNGYGHIVVMLHVYQTSRNSSLQPVNISIQNNIGQDAFEDVF